MRGSSTPRGGYNARSCQQRASVPTTRAGVNNARRCGQRASVPITNVRAGGPRRRQVRRSRRPTGTATCLPQWVFSRSDAVGLTQEATAGRAMSTSMVALNGRPGTPGRLLTHGPRRARAQSHRGRQQCIGVDNLPTPIGGSLPQCGSRARRESGGLIRARSHSDSTWSASRWGPVVRLTARPPFENAVSLAERTALAPLPDHFSVHDSDEGNPSGRARHQTEPGTPTGQARTPTQNNTGRRPTQNNTGQGPTQNNTGQGPRPGGRGPRPPSHEGVSRSTALRRRNGMWCRR